MPTIRKRGQRYQVQVRRLGQRPLSRSFHLLKDAQTWARQVELQADRHGLPPDPKALQQITLAELVGRYRDTITPRKRSSQGERAVLNAFLKHPICRFKISEITRADFAAYRDDRLKEIKPSSLRRSLVPIHNLYELAKGEWGLPIHDNPLADLKIPGADSRRERRLREGEWDRLAAASQECRNPLLLPIIKFAVLTGLRRGETR
jgi:integrase